MLPNGVDGLTRQCRVQKFIVECMVYAVTLEHKSYGWSTCRSWPSLQNGTAFFASTRLFAIGDALALLRAGNDAATRAYTAGRPLCTSVGGQVRRAGADLHLPF
jgi:Tfp pilus assembly protein PilZ